MERSENLCSSTCTHAVSSHAGDIHLKPMRYPPHGMHGRLVINTLTGQWAPGISIDYAASSTDNLQVCEILPNIYHLFILYSWTWPFPAIISAVVYILWLWRFHITCCRNIKCVPGISNEMWRFSVAISQWKILHKNINMFFYILTPEHQ